MLSTDGGHKRPEPPANPSLLPTISCQERKWGKRWVLFFGPRAWGWPACRQEKGNLERFPLRICQIMQERRRPQGMRLPAENALHSPQPQRPGAPPGPACQSLQVSEKSHNMSGRPPGPSKLFEFLPTSRASNKGLSLTHKYTHHTTDPPTAQ